MRIRFVLKLDKLRHFIFLNDPVPFFTKNAIRLYFAERFALAAFVKFLQNILAHPFAIAAWWAGTKVILSG